MSLAYLFFLLFAETSSEDQFLKDLLIEYKDKPFYKIIFSDKFENLLRDNERVQILWNVHDRNQVSCFSEYFYEKKYSKLPEDIWLKILSCLDSEFLQKLEKSLHIFMENELRMIAILNLVVRGIDTNNLDKDKLEKLLKDENFFPTNNKVFYSQKIDPKQITPEKVKKITPEEVNLFYEAYAYTTLIVLKGKY